MSEYRVWECQVCALVYDEAKGWPDDGIAPGTRWEDVPADWMCPECGVGKADFEMIAVGTSKDTTTTAQAAPPATESQWKVWECLVCGWIYDEARGWPEDDIAPGTKWEDIPEDWLCPECGVGKSDFEMVQVGGSTATAAAAPATSKTDPSISPVVIIGSGMAGYGLAKEIRKADEITPIIIITGDDGAYYSKPLISTGYHRNKLPEELITASASKMSADLDIQVKTLTRVSSIDVAGKAISTSGGSITYGKLVLATGASCIEPPLAGNAASEVHSINDLTDYATFRKAASGKKRVLIIGAGLIGSEYANDMIQAGYEINVVDPLPGALASLLPESASAAVTKALGEAGVIFHFGTTVEAIDRPKSGGIGKFFGKKNKVLVATLASGDTLEADIILSAIGVRPNTGLAESAGLDVGRGIKTNRALETSVADIYAVGDCAEVDGHSLVYVAPLMDGVRALARTLAGARTEVCYGAMPVTIKTTLFPVVTNPPARDAKGTWEEETNEQGTVSRFIGEDGSLQGFALTGERVSMRDELAKAAPPIMKKGNR